MGAEMIVLVIQGLLVLSAVMLVAAWVRRYRNTPELRRTSPFALGLSAVINFFDTLGIGGFAPTTAVIKFLKLTPDGNIPGTLMVGYALSGILGAIIYLGIIEVSTTVLVVCVIAGVLGAVIGARIVTALPVRAIRLGMGCALLVAALFYSMRNLGLMPGGDGGTLGLEGASLGIAAVGFLLFGALMTLGIGIFAPALMLLTMLGMDARAVFPVMMASSALLMPAGSLRFIETGRLDPKLVVSFAIGGLPGVLLAAFLVKEMPLEILRWLVTAAVLVAAALMLASAAKPETARA